MLRNIVSQPGLNKAARLPFGALQEVFAHYAGMSELALS